MMYINTNKINHENAENPLIVNRKKAVICWSQLPVEEHFSGRLSVRSNFENMAYVLPTEPKISERTHLHPKLNRRLTAVRLPIHGNIEADILAVSARRRSYEKGCTSGTTHHTTASVHTPSGHTSSTHHHHIITQTFNLSIGNSSKLFKKSTFGICIWISLFKIQLALIDGVALWSLTNMIHDHMNKSTPTE